MKSSRQFLQIALTVTAGLAIALGTSTAFAGKRAGDPPLKTRDVIADATVICSGTPTGYAALDNACALLADSDGWRTGGARGCTEDFVGAGLVSYTGRNCDNNERSLRRYAASSVLSLDDVLNGNASRAGTAASYLCGYASTYDSLLGAGKLTPMVDVDLGADATDIVVNDLGLSCAI